MNRQTSLPWIAALVTTAATSACTASQSWNETPEASAAETVAPPTVAPSAPTVVAPVASTPTVGSSSPPDASKKGVKSCKDVTLEPTKDGGASACSDTNGIVVVAIWHLEGTGKTRRAAGTINRFQSGEQSLHTVAATDDPTVIAALETADASSLDVRPEAGAVRVGLIVSVGEDHRTSTEIASIFLENETKAVWTGLGTRSESEMDACTKTSAVTFTFPDESHIERITVSSATFTPQQLDAALLAKLKKGCVAAKPATKTEKIVMTR